VIWRDLQSADLDQALKLSRTPMGGTIQTSWGFREFRCPNGCSDLLVGVVESNTRVVGMAMRWRWPDGSPYLSGLRVAPDLNTKPPRSIWTQAYQTLLKDREVAWTTVGEENRRARRLLEKGCTWLPRYIPRMSLTTVCAPLAASQRRKPAGHTLNRCGVEVADHRRLEIPGGKGLGYRVGRWSYRLGRPGIPPPGVPIRLGFLEPKGPEPLTVFSDVLSQIHGLDALAMVLPGEIEKTSLHWNSWKSILYQVHWTDKQEVSIPEWKGIWL